MGLDWGVSRQIKFHSYCYEEQQHDLNPRWFRLDTPDRKMEAHHTLEQVHTNPVAPWVVPFPLFSVSAPTTYPHTWFLSTLLFQACVRTIKTSKQASAHTHKPFTGWKKQVPSISCFAQTLKYIHIHIHIYKWKQKKDCGKKKDEWEWGRRWQRVTGGRQDQNMLHTY